MLRSPLPTFVALILMGIAATVHAAGFNLSWDDCGSSGTALKTFACDTDAGHQDLIMSAIVPADMPQVIGVEAVLYLSVESGQTLPNWWHLAPNQCRASQISLILDRDNNPTTCPSIYHPGELFGGLAWDSQYQLPWRARLRFAAATQSSNPITAGVEYTAGRIRITHAGTATCSGCSMPACIYIERLKIAQPAGVGDTQLVFREASGQVGWQCPSNDYSGGCSIDSGCATSARTPSWGAIKSMYH